MADKATRNEVKRIDMIIEAVYHRLKHMSVLQNELSRALVPTKQSGSYSQQSTINAKL